MFRKKNQLYFFLHLWIVSLSFADSDVQPKERTYVGLDGVIAAYGDFNSDKFTDLFMINTDARCFEIIRQLPDKTEHDSQIFQTDRVLKGCFNGQQHVVGLIPSDFDGDAMMDLVVISVANPGSSKFELRFFKGSKTHIENNTNIAPFAEVDAHPLLLDYNGDMISDLLIARDNKYWIYYGAEKNQFSNKIQFTTYDIAGAPQSPNSNAFIDLNQDGIADIFIQGKDKMSYWFTGSPNKEKPDVIINYPSSIKYEMRGMSIFCDINDDEKIDHILPVCKKEGQAPCSILMYDEKKNTWIELVKEVSTGENEFYFSEFSAFNKKIKVPVRLRHGYLSDNGYTDLMSLMRKKGGNKDEAHVVIFKNQKLSASSNTTFEVVALDKSNGTRPIIAAFFDLYEDGVFDILISYEITKDHLYNFKSVSLKEFAGVNFVKVLVTSGLCTDGGCFEKRVTGETYRVPYGTNSPGSMVCYQLVNAQNEVMKSCGGQMSQSGDFSLQMPYTIFGLGLYANYIEKLSATIPSGLTYSARRKTVEQIVPDSQIVFIPNPSDEPTQWKVQLFLTPSDIIYKTLYTLSGICVILMFIIGVLHRKEMLEDVKEQAEFKKQWPEIRR